MNQRKAFTLMEMMVVIIIVTVLALLAIAAYGSARQQARRDIAVDSIVSALRSQQTLARSGRLSEEGEEGENLCYGMFFTTDDPYVQVIEAPYFPVGAKGADYCDVDQNSLQEFTPLEALEVREISELGSPSDDVAIIFKPPFANIVLTDASFTSPSPPLVTTTPNIEVTIGLPEDEEPRIFRIDTSSGFIERVYEQQEQ